MMSLPTMCIADQRLIGAASGFAGSARSLISVVGTVVYSVILSARMNRQVPALVPPALVQSGLPATSVPDFITAYSQGAPLTTIPGVNPTIIEAGSLAFKKAYSTSFSTIFLASIAFSVLATVVALFIPNVESKMTDEVSATLHTWTDSSAAGQDIQGEKGGL